MGVSTVCAAFWHMTIIGIGVDLLHVPRFYAFIRRRGLSRISRRILSVVELDQYPLTSAPESSDLQCRYLAVRWVIGIYDVEWSDLRECSYRWAVKEAAYKALYPTYKATWKDLSLLRLDHSPKPTLSLDIPTAGNVPVKLHVSVSHDGEYLVAQVLAEEMHRL